MSSWLRKTIQRPRFIESLNDSLTKDVIYTSVISKLMSYGYKLFTEDFCKRLKTLKERNCVFGSRAGLSWLRPCLVLKLRLPQLRWRDANTPPLFLNLSLFSFHLLLFVSEFLSYCAALSVHSAFNGCHYLCHLLSAFLSLSSASFIGSLSPERLIYFETQMPLEGTLIKKLAPLQNVVSCLLRPPIKGVPKGSIK